MKKQVLATAIASALAGSAGAVNVNPDGLGQVLLYSYYTVQGDQATLVSVVNSTGEAKAVKVRFLEGKNSREVLDFNLYLSAYDVWVAAIVATADGAKLTTPDKSCTVPAIPAAGVDFRNFAYTGAQADGEDTSLKRTREGHVEMIEMGVVTDDGSFTPATWATHVDGVPRDCPKLVQAWTPGGVWATTPGRAVDMPAGGLFGGGLIIQVEKGTNASYNPLALEGFYVPESSTADLHTAPGNLDPNLASALPAISYVYNGVDVTTTNWGTGAQARINAVSATMMHNTLLNEFNVEQGLAAATDWVVTLPTKWAYVNDTTDPKEPIPPFTSVFKKGGACEVVSLKLWDREERTTVGDVDFSPPPPSGRNELCWETNIITFNETNALLSENLLHNINTDFENGWMRLSFDDAQNVLTAPDQTKYYGLPAIGFAQSNYVGVGGAIFNGTFEHRATREIVSEQGPPPPQ